MSIEKLVISQEQKPFTTHLNSVLQNLRNPEALGVWCYLSSLPPTWIVNKEQLRKHFNIGRDKLDNILTYLKDHNLLTMQGVRDKEGKFIHWQIHVLSGKDFISEAQSTENPDTGIQYTENPVSGKPHQWKTAPINKTNTNKDFKQKKEKSFYMQKSEQKKLNEKKHDFADSMNQMANEKRHIEKHEEMKEEIKRTPMPDSLRQLYKSLRIC